MMSGKCYDSHTHANYIHVYTLVLIREIFNRGSRTGFLVLFLGCSLNFQYIRGTYYVTCETNCDKCDQF